MIRVTKGRLITCLCLLVVWLGVIWGNSMTPGQVSGQLSGWASAIIGKLLPFLSPESENGHLLVRKLAHFSEFAVLGLLFKWLLAMAAKKKWPGFFMALLCGMATAVIDECIQIFSPGRMCSFWDMCIDWSGVLMGILLLTLILTITEKKRMTK